MEVSCSSSLSLHQVDFSLLPIHHRRSKASVSIHDPVFSAKFKTPSDCHGHRRVLAVCTVSSYSSPSFSSSAFATSISRSISLNVPSREDRGRLPMPISAVFERFTERAIKAVMFSQREAKVLGKDMVFNQHLLLGLVAEDRSPDGFLGSGITIDKARETVGSIWADDDSAAVSNDSSVTASSSTHIPFSISTKRVFEAAVEYSRSMGYNFKLGI